MPLRKHRGAMKPDSEGRYDGLKCNIRKLCFLGISFAFAIVAFQLYADQELARNLNGPPSALIRKPVEFLAAMADVIDVKNTSNADTSSLNSDDEDQTVSFPNDVKGREQSQFIKSENNEENSMVYTGIDEQYLVADSQDDDQKNEDYTLDHNLNNTTIHSAGLANPTDIDNNIETLNPHHVQENHVIEHSEGEEERDSQDTYDDASVGNQAAEQKDDKPHLYLHVGPQKTGSSTLQSALDIMSGLTYKLEADNLQYRHITPENGDFDCKLGPWGGFIDCKPSNQLINFIDEAYRAGDNLLLTDENLGVHFVGALREAINDNDWNVKVIVVYRRIHEWLVSWYNQINKSTNIDSTGSILLDKQGNPYREEHKNWPDEGGIYIPDFTTWYKEYTKYWQPSELVGKHRSIEYYNLYRPMFKQVKVYNMHEKGDLVTNFMCNIISDASDSCSKLLNHEIYLPKVNPSVILEHDILAVYAYDKGLINRTLSRQEVVASITRFVQVSKVTIPYRCDPNTTSQILSWLIDSERVMFENSGWVVPQEDELRTEFDLYLIKGKLCDVDKEAALGSDDWLRFFQTLG